MTSKTLRDKEKIHKTHFPVPDIKLHDKGRDSGFKWVRSGDGHWKLVPKTAENDGVAT